MGINLRKTYNNWYKSILKQKRNKKLPPQSIKFYQNILSALKEYNKKKNPKILDVACGIGHFLQEAQRSMFEVYGVDISDMAVRQAEKLTGAKIVRGNAENLPFKKDTFDFVTCIGSLEHFSNAEKALTEMSRVLKSQGVCFLHVPNLMFVGHIYMAMRDGSMPSEGGQQFSESYRTYLGWKKLIEENGMKVIRCDTYNEMFATKKVNAFIKLLWQAIGKHIVPFHFSYAFDFYCKKEAP